MYCMYIYVTERSDRSSSVPISVLHSVVDKGQGLRSGILVLFKRVLPVQLVKIVIMALLCLYTRMIPCRYKKVIIFKNNLFRHRLLFCKKYVTGQADEWMDGKAVLRIAFAFNKARKEYRLSSTFSCVSSECYSGFIKNVVFGLLLFLSVIAYIMEERISLYQ